MTVPAVREYVERELLRRFDDGWLLHSSSETPGTESLPSTVTFVFRRARLDRRGRRGRASQPVARAERRAPLRRRGV